MITEIIKEDKTIARSFRDLGCGDFFEVGYSDNVFIKLDTSICSAININTGKIKMFEEDGLVWVYEKAILGGI